MSAADKLHNARCILADYRLKGKKVWKRFNAPQGKILWYYRSLVKARQKARGNPLVYELARVVETLEHEVRRTPRRERTALRATLKAARSPI